jgi:hypothetical protein
MRIDDLPRGILATADETAVRDAISHRGSLTAVS